ncbi:response regulator [Haladaptatus sp. DJG-WS-42]|uniref:response regulator n=1 Tax=Haladaptatus sp. DJG-WS-42 TaxID=3120516 RepID=UPI0030CF5AEA
MVTAAQPTVLIVEDELDVAETYERWLAADYTVVLATSGSEALSKLDDSVDVVLLDRMMPEMSGDAVLEEIRSRDIDCRVAMVTAVDPDFDIIEMGFDEYVTKPPTRDQLRDTVERLLARGAVAGDLQQYFSLVARKAALEAEFTRRVLESNEEYNDLVARIERARANLDTSFDGLSSDSDFIGVLRAIVDDDSSSDTS